MIRPPAPGAAPRPLEGARILVVEDEPMIALLLEIVFQDAGATVLLSRTVPSALGHIEENVPHAAVLDVNLGPGVTCEPICDRLRMMGTPFVIHSGDLARLGELVVELGAPVIPKPASEAVLVEAVAGLLEGAQLS